MRCRRRTIVFLLFYVFALFNMACLWSYSRNAGNWPTSAAFRLLLLPWIAADTISTLTEREYHQFDQILKEAAINKTVIVTPLNKAWAAKLLDNFLASFHNGDGTSGLISSIVFIALDRFAYNRCTDAHPYCILLPTNGVDYSAEKPYMTPDYLRMTRRKISVLSIILQMGYNIVFSDADVLWLRNPFHHFSPAMDMELACDFFNGNETDVRNLENTGFMHVRSNSRTVELFKYWDRNAKFYSHIHDQEVFDRVKLRRDFQAIGTKLRFMPTRLFSGFCEPSSDLDNVCTMHANCCRGLESKRSDLKLVQEDWNLFMRTRRKANRVEKFRAPKACLDGCFLAFTSEPCYKSCRHKKLLT